MEAFDRLAGAVEAAIAVMAEASEDIKWLKEHPQIVEVIKDDPEAKLKMDELAGKLEMAAGTLKVDTDATNPPVEEPVAEEPAPVEEPVVEEPAPVEETPAPEVVE